MEYELRAHAKVNLALDVLSERPDGYHEIDTVMQELELHDIITIEQGRGGFVIASDNPDLPLDANNLVYKAWSLLRDQAENDSVVIEIQKNIPLSAGLAGGSTDAAATLVGLNRFWSLGLSDGELEKLGEQIGSDVPFFIRGGLQRAKGRGEILEALEPMDKKFVLLINTGEFISSKYVYDHVETNGTIQIDSLVEALSGNSVKAYGHMENQLETVSFETVPALKDIKHELIQTGASVSMMSGSGPTMFGIYETYEEANRAYELLHEKYPHVILTETI